MHKPKHIYLNEKNRFDNLINNKKNSHEWKKVVHSNNKKNSTTRERKKKKKKKIESIDFFVVDKIWKE